MNSEQIRSELSIRCKNGIPFLMAATIVWTIILSICFMSYKVESKNIMILYSAGLIFPLAILIAKVIKAEWKTNDNVLGLLGLYLNIAQIMYFPLLFWAFSKNAEYMIMFLAVITGAHFFPYGWYYNAKGYFIMAPLISISITIMGWNISEFVLWRIPLTMIVLLLVLNVWLYIDWNKKRLNIECDYSN